ARFPAFFSMKAAETSALDSLSSMWGIPNFAHVRRKSAMGSFVAYRSNQLPVADKKAAQACSAV
ncbi:hypothetical protein ACCS65_36650, partial [Rhizobium ruizarguesonis]